MCAPNSIHDKAQAELDEILAKGTISQQLALQAAWCDAVVSCRNRIFGTATLQTYPSIGTSAPAGTSSVYMYEFTYPPLSLVGNPPVKAVAYGAVYPDGGVTCSDVLSCDVTQRSWWHGPMDPVDRALGRIP